MLINLQNNLHWLIYIASLIASISLFADQLLIFGIICLLGGIYGWLISALVFKQYAFQYFLYVICASGILISIVFFFINGVEQVPFPEGAVLFNTAGIAQALFLFFIFTMPIMIYNHGTDTILSIKDSQILKKHKEVNSHIDSDDEDWEQATLDDLESEKFEVI